jgi:hypothetical protein
VGFRETINQNRNLTMAVAAAIILVVLIVVILQLRGGPAGKIAETRGFFTTNGGQSWFTDSLANIPPYEAPAGTAVRAHVFRCNGQEFVGYLESYTPEGKQAIEQFLAQNPHLPPDPGIYKTELETHQILFRRPDDSEWHPATGPLANEIRMVRCQDGSSAFAVRP